MSHNIIDGELNLTGLNNLQVLDLTMNRIHGEISLTFPGICDSLVVANISNNNFTGEIGTTFDQCWNLRYLDLSYNNLTGGLSFGFDKLKEFSVSKTSVMALCFRRFHSKLHLAGVGFIRKWICWRSA